MGAFGSGIVVIPTTNFQGVGVPRLGTYVNPTQPTQGINYTSKGERWDVIAYKMYGDASKVGPLVLNNPGILAIDYIPQGTVVFVPLLTPIATVTTSTPWG